MLSFVTVPSELESSLTGLDLAEYAWSRRDEDPDMVLRVARGFDRSVDEICWACGQIMLAYLSYRDGQFDESMAHAFEVEGLFPPHTGGGWRARLLNMIAINYDALGEYPASYDYLQQQLAHAQWANLPEEVAIAYHDLAMNFLQKGLTERAEEYLNLCRTAVPDDPVCECWVLMNLSELSRQQGDFVRAETMGRASVELAVTHRLLRVGFFASECLARAMAAVQRYDEALAIYEGAYERFGLAAAHTCETKIRMLEILISCERLDQAEKLLAELGPMIALQSSLGLTREYHLLASQLFKRRKRWEEALNHHEAYHQFHFRMFSQDRETKDRALDVVHRLHTLRHEAEVLQARNEALNRSIEELSDLNQQIRELSIRDSLTGLFNRRHFLDRVSDMLNSPEMGPTSIVMIDVDHFKQVNDLHGHLVGDAVLVRIARLLEGGLREEDVIGRFGGEEFIVALGNRDSDLTTEICERLLQEVSGHDWSGIAPGLAVSVSMGLAVSRPGTGLGDLIHRADQQLYAAKRAGKNRISIAPVPKPVDPTKKAPVDGGLLGISG